MYIFMILYAYISFFIELFFCVFLSGLEYLLSNCKFKIGVGLFLTYYLSTVAIQIPGMPEIGITITIQIPNTNTMNILYLNG